MELPKYDTDGSDAEIMLWLLEGIHHQRKTRTKASLGLIKAAEGPHALVNLTDLCSLNPLSILEELRLPSGFHPESSELGSAMRGVGRAEFDVEKMQQAIEDNLNEILISRMRRCWADVGGEIVFMVTGAEATPQSFAQATCDYRVHKYTEDSVSLYEYEIVDNHLRLVGSRVHYKKDYGHLLILPFGNLKQALVH